MSLDFPSLPDLESLFHIDREVCEDVKCISLPKVSNWYVNSVEKTPNIFPAR
jgi:hypothetical protein